MNGFTVEEKKTGKSIVLVCTGTMDFTGSNQGDDFVKKVIEKNETKIIFDLGEVSYISSSGWTVFLGNLRAARENNGDIILANMSPEIKHNFKLLQLDNLIDSCDTVLEAVKRMN